MILIFSVYGFFVFSNIADSSELFSEKLIKFNNHIMEDDQNDERGIIVLFREDVIVEIGPDKKVLINGLNHLDELLRAYNASFKKLFIDVDKEYSRNQNLEQYYIISTKVNPEQLKDQLIKFDFMEAAYIKSKDEDPGL